MSHIKIYLLSLLLCFAYIFNVHGQNYYEVVHNASGIIVESEDQEQIDQAVQSLIDVLPENIQSNFKVYTADFYIHQQSYSGSYPELFLNIANNLTSPYYVFIAKGIVTVGDVAEWYVVIKLPEEDDFECLSDENRKLLINLLNVTSNHYSVGSESHTLGITSALNKLTHHIKVIVDCACDFSDPNCAKSLFERNDDYLLGMGFRKRKVDIGPARIWVNGTAGIFDFTSEKSSLIIDGKEYYIPEEVYDNKVLLDNGNFVEEDDEFTVDFKGRVYIFDDSSFKGGSNEQAWFDAFNISTTEDYVEYWVLLQDDKSKIWYLYSRYTLGPIVPPGRAIWDAEEEGRSVSPLSLLLKFTMNAVIDIMIESTANYIFESNIDNWNKAFESVNYTRIAADALYSLIPWREPHKKYEILGRTLIGGVGRVLDKSKNNSNYSVQEGFEDFVVGCGTGALVAIVVPLAVKGVSKMFTGLVKLIKSSNSPKIKKVAIGCFSNRLNFYGCFVKDTPVLMAVNTIGNSGKVYAMAAMMPFAMVPLDDTPLLGYALANKTVNSSYQLTASNDEDVYMVLMNGDPYTSAEQKQRDLYVINDTQWHSVSFEGLQSSSMCHLAMHQDWITNHGYVVDGIVNMNLPEQDDRLFSDEGRKSSDTKSLDKQGTESNWISASTNSLKVGWNVGDIQYLNMPEMGISGPFRITAIKHILPQKKPESDPGEGYEWKPVTGLFVHQSDQVHNISFDNNETVGVTAPHPIFSTTFNDWRLAGELEVGEKVLTYHGESTVTKTEKKGGREAVYNLEVKDLHNFLVGESGVVVHNNCINALFNLHKGLFKNADDVVHIMRGNIKNGKAGGVHHISAITQGTAKEIGERIVGPNGLYKVKVSVKDANGFIAKTDNGGYSTFFPESWDQIKVLDEIKHAVTVSNRNLVKGNEYWGYATDGITKIHYYLRTDGTIISAFPKF